MLIALSAKAFMTMAGRCAVIQLLSAVAQEEGEVIKER
jgi:DNA invertase Pin-like site-specific DNA recombinase